MINKICTDSELQLLRNKKGYILNIDSINKVIKLHLTSCKYCNPSEIWGIQVESKEVNKTGETWFSDNKEEANAKASLMVVDKSYQYSTCKICNP